MARRSCLFWFFVAHYLSITHAQSISTNTPVPPLQWLNITGLLQGSSPPPLKYPSIGYDETTRNLLIYGGLSAGGIATDETFLLNLATNSWSTPTNQPNLPQAAPPARYMTVGGDDFSSSYRHAHLIIGGKGESGQALSDAWEFDYINQFWSELTVSPGGPPSRWSASGGRDYRTPADITSTNTTFFMSGGTDGTTMYPLTDVWEFTVTGALSSNNNNNTSGSWSKKVVGNTPGYSVEQASTVLGTSIISVSGCNTTESDINCAGRNSYVISLGSSSSEIALQACSAPRYGATMVFNPLSISNFPSQVFLLLGTFNSSLWNDQAGLQRGEVAILDTSTGDWNRILPAGDPGTDGVPTYPSPREGAVALSYGQALVGTNRQIAADTIVFGGEDQNGNFLSEVWILRAYNGSISSSNSSWGGPGGNLQTGVNANGAGVTVQYLSQCAVGLATPTSAPSSTPATSTPSGHQPFQVYDVSLIHKLCAPLSVALALPAILLARLALPSVHSQSPGRSFVYLASSIAIVAWGVGVVGLIFSFTSIRLNTSVSRRDLSNLVLRTAHSIVGSVLFIGLYIILPLLYLGTRWAQRSRSQKVVDNNSEAARSRANSVETAEKLATAQQTQRPPASPASPRARQHSWGGSSFWLGGRSTEGRASSDSGSLHSAGVQRGFEVLNRPTRTRRASTNGIVSSGDVYQRVPIAPRSLGDADWFDRRRSFNAANSLDYTIHTGLRAHATSNPSSANATDMPSTGPFMPASSCITYELPSPLESCSRVSCHVLVLGLCILSLVALWYSAPVSLFAIFLLWTVLFYITLFVFAWQGRPTRSLLTALITYLRAKAGHTTPAIPPGTPGSRPLSMAGTEQFLFDSRGPYLHHPPYRTAVHDDPMMTPLGPRSEDTDDDDIDEDTRQRQIEEEMGRREVSIVTVPKRRLWVANPS